MAEKDNINEMDIDIDSEKKEVPEVVKEEKKENEEYEKFCFMCHLFFSFHHAHLVFSLSMFYLIQPYYINISHMSTFFCKF